MDGRRETGASRAPSGQTAIVPTPASRREMKRGEANGARLITSGHSPAKRRSDQADPGGAGGSEARDAGSGAAGGTGTGVGGPVR